MIREKAKCTKQSSNNILMIQDFGSFYILEFYAIPDAAVILDPAIIHVIVSSQVSGDEADIASRDRESDSDCSFVAPQAVESGPHEGRFHLPNPGQQVALHEDHDHDALQLGRLHLHVVEIL